MNARNMTLLLIIINSLLVIFLSGCVDEKKPSNAIVLNRTWQHTVNDDYFLNKKNINRQIFIDTRSDKDFKEGHFKNSISLQLKQLTNNEAFPKKVIELENHLSQQGILHSENYVIVGDGDLLNSSRIFWILKSLGLKKLKMYVGNVQALQKKGLALSTKIPTVTSSEFYSNLEPSVLATKEMVLRAINSKSTQLIDARSSNTHTIISKIPSSQFFDWTSLYIGNSQDGKFSKSLAEKRLKKFKKNKKYITYCELGRHANILYFVMLNLGYDVKHYGGSMNQWRKDKTNPLEEVSSQ